ncbi:MAG TPA: hypothetical protein VND94_04120 [Terriglobia bacterium]|nr:hypothetical protein [Terriglobia bacterium]
MQTEQLAGFATTSMTFEALWLVTFQAPKEDVARVLEAVTAVTPLRIGKYDRNAFETATGTEHYRPLDGAAAGAESETRLRPGVAEVSFQLPRDNAVLERVVEAIFAVHSYEEPVILLREILASRSRGLPDKDNPHRWWNQGGDWKKAEAAN